MKNGKITIGIDFDGVISQLAFGRRWSKKPVGKKIERVEKLWTGFLQLFKKEIPGVEHSLKKLKKSGCRLILVTSRTANVEALTISWLKRKRLFQYFDQLIFNKQSQLPWEMKAQAIYDKEIKYFIDDSPEVISNLEKMCPEVNLIWFGGGRSGFGSRVSLVKKWVDIENIVL